MALPATVPACVRLALDWDNRWSVNFQRSRSQGPISVSITLEARIIPGSATERQPTELSSSIRRPPPDDLPP